LLRALQGERRRSGPFRKRAIAASFAL
jgi:hypothetical protein